MKTVFEYNNSRQLIKERIELMPRKGYGQLRKLAAHVGVHTTFMSQVVHGYKSLNSDQAYLVAQFFGFNETEIDYFINLVHLERAGLESYKHLLRKKLGALRLLATDVSSRISVSRKLSDDTKAEFYSDWVYSAVRQLTAIPHFDSRFKIGSYLGLSANKINRVVNFLLKTGLCLEEKGKLRIGPTSTHVDANSVWVRMHHLNWRQRALNNLSNYDESDLHFTSPLTLSKKDAEKIRTLLLKCIEEMDLILEPSPSEEFYCLNIDWFRNKNKE